MQLFPINMEDENVKKYTLKRVITALFTLLAILLVLFVLMQLMPGSPFNDEKLNDSQRGGTLCKIWIRSTGGRSVFPICRKYAEGRFWS